MGLEDPDARGMLHQLSWVHGNDAAAIEKAADTLDASVYLKGMQVHYNPSRVSLRVWNICI